MIQESITTSQIGAFQAYMYENEKAQATIEKYVHEIELLGEFLEGRKLTKKELLDYREYLLAMNKVQTVNGKLSAINSFLVFSGMQVWKLRFLRVQHKAFVEEKRELSETEYRRLLTAAERQGNQRLYHVMLTIAGTGIRISELKFITVEAVRNGKAQIRLKGKNREILLQKHLRERLMKYAEKCGIREGYIFRTRNGNPVDRSNICHAMKKLCKLAGVPEGKVFPHNFRHLFARSFYAVEKNLAHLADILGHSSIETTRIYVMASAKTYERTLGKMSLVI